MSLSLPCARRALQGALLGVVVLNGFAIGRTAWSQPPVPDHCGIGIPSDEALGFAPLPRGDVFCPLIADPKSTHSFASYQREESLLLGADIGAIGVADRFGMLRWGGPRAGEGLQLSLSGGVFAQFDLNSASYDLINADYVFGLPLTFRRGAFSSRLRLYHQSSHLGDEFLLREGLPPERENLSFESAELLVSHERSWLRFYAGGEYLFLRQPSDFEPLIGHGGVELRPGGHVLSLGSLGSVHLVAALDVKAAEEQEWTPAWSARGGFEILRPHNGGEPGRGWSLMFEYYDGPSPYGQFYRDYMRFLGLGVHFMG